MTNELKRSRISGPTVILLLGLGLLMVGLLIAVGSDLVEAGVGTPPGVVHTPFSAGTLTRPLGTALLVIGTAVGAGVLGYLMGTRRR